MSAKRRETFGDRVPRSTLAGGGTIKPKKRKPSEFARIYGSRQRVAWVQRQPSVASGKGPCENVHVCSGGMGRKADARFIVPLTAEEHRELHAVGIKSFEARYGLSLEFHAALIEARWQTFSRASTHE